MKTNVHTCKRPKLKTPQMPINRRMGKSPKKKKKKKIYLKEYHIIMKKNQL